MGAFLYLLGCRSQGFELHPPHPVNIKIVKRCYQPSITQRLIHLAADSHFNSFSVRSQPKQNAAVPLFRAWDPTQGTGAGQWIACRLRLLPPLSLPKVPLPRGTLCRLFKIILCSVVGRQRARKRP